MKLFKTAIAINWVHCSTTSSLHYALQQSTCLRNLLTFRESIRGLRYFDQYYLYQSRTEVEFGAFYLPLQESRIRFLKICTSHPQFAHSVLRHSYTRYNNFLEIWKYLTVKFTGFSANVLCAKERCSHRYTSEDLTHWAPDSRFRVGRELNRPCLSSFLLGRQWQHVTKWN